MDKMNNLYRWVKWSDKIPDRQYNYHVKVFYHSGNGTYNSTAYFNGVTFIDSTQTNYDNPILINVSEWLEPIDDETQKLQSTIDERDKEIERLKGLIEKMALGIKYKENASKEYIDYLCEILNYPDKRNNQKLIRLYNNWNQSYLIIPTENNL